MTVPSNGRTAASQAKTALEECASNYRILFESISEIVTVYEVIRDPDGRIAACVLCDGNPAFVETAGGAALEHLRGRTSREIMGDSWFDSHLPAVQEAMDSGQARVQEVYHPESDRYFITTVTPLDENRYLGTGRDISERRRAEQALKELNEQLEARVRERTQDLAANMEMLRQETAERVRVVEELNQKERLLVQQNRQAAVGEMVGNIAHQWRQPLNVLGLMVQELGLLQELGQLDHQKMGSFVSKAMGQIGHMAATIDDFRNFFKPDKETVRFKVQDELRRTLSLLAGAFKAEHLQVETASEGDQFVEGHPNEFCQVLMNIITNARDALNERKPAEPWIKIRVAREDDRAVVLIADNAGGIPEAIIGNVFDPYFTTKGPEAGTGVGLFMAKTIIERNMAGALSVRNTAAGAEFRIELPARDRPNPIIIESTVLTSQMSLGESSE